jgi:hypothetical protein
VPIPARCRHYTGWQLWPSIAMLRGDYGLDALRQRSPQLAFFAHPR